MFLIISFILCIGTAARTVNGFDCSVYQSDKQIIQSLPFSVVINPRLDDPMLTSYAWVFNGGYVSALSLKVVESVPPSIFCLKHLSQLSIQSVNQVVNLEGISRLSQTLLNLELVNVKLGQSTLPTEVFSLLRLTSLTCDYCGLKSLPDDIKNLTSLQNLTIPRNELSSLPSTLNELYNLISITVSNNPSLSSLDVINGKSYIIELKASFCSIDHLPLNLSGLQIFEFTGNKLTNIEQIGSIRWAAVKSVRFDQNLISMIPVGISKIDNVEYLDFSGNLLTEVPEEVYRIRKLDAINLSNNKFQINELQWIVGRFRQTQTKLYT